MKQESKWYRDIMRQLAPYQDSLDKKQAKKLKLDLLPRIAARLDQFSDTCGQCQLYQQDLKSLVGEIGNLSRFPGKEPLKKYRKSLNEIEKHLIKEHKLVKKGQYVGIGIAIGVAIGSGVSAALDNPGLSGVGIALGVAIGSYLGKKAEREGKIL